MPLLQYQKSIDACIECATMCNHCAVSCLEEKDVQQLTKCIRLDLDCAIICRVTAELMSLSSAYSSELAELCATVCTACAQECQKHADMEHCNECADACRKCAEEIMKVYDAASIDATANPVKPVLQQEECIAISRAAAELMSLSSAYASQMSQLSAAVCRAYGQSFEKFLKTEMKVSRDRALVATEIHQDLLIQDRPGSAQSQEQGIKKKKKHSSALLAASMYRSPVSAVSSNSYLAAGGDSTGIESQYKEPGGIG